MKFSRMLGMAAASVLVGGLTSSVQAQTPQVPPKAMPAPQYPSKVMPAPQSMPVQGDAGPAGAEQGDARPASRRPRRCPRPGRRRPRRCPRRSSRPRKCRLRRLRAPAPAAAPETTTKGAEPPPRLPPPPRRLGPRPRPRPRRRRCPGAPGPGRTQALKHGLNRAMNFRPRSLVIRSGFLFPKAARPTHQPPLPRSQSELFAILKIQRLLCLRNMKDSRNRVQPRTTEFPRSPSPCAREPGGGCPWRVEVNSGKLPYS